MATPISPDSVQCFRRMKWAERIVCQQVKLSAPRNPTRPRSILAAKVNKRFRCEMKQLAIALALSSVFAFSPAAPAFALETPEAKIEAGDAASRAILDMFEAFGFRTLKPGQYLWRNIPDSAGAERVVISLTDQ